MVTRCLYVQFISLAQLPMSTFAIVVTEFDGYLRQRCFEVVKTLESIGGLSYRGSDLHKLSWS